MSKSDQTVQKCQNIQKHLKVSEASKRVHCGSKSVQCVQNCREVSKTQKRVQSQKVLLETFFGTPCIEKSGNWIDLSPPGGAHFGYIAIGLNLCSSVQSGVGLVWCGMLHGLLSVGRLASKHKPTWRRVTNSVLPPGQTLPLTHQLSFLEDPACFLFVNSLWSF